jgi:hypothetical protein
MSVRLACPELSLGVLFGLVLDLDERGVEEPGVLADIGLDGVHRGTCDLLVLADAGLTVEVGGTAPPCPVGVRALALIGREGMALNRDSKSGGTDPSSSP